MKNRLHATINWLDENELDDIHYSSLELLERTGVNIQDKECLDLLYKAGASISAPYRVRIPSALVEHCLGTAPKKVTLADRKGRRVLFLEKNKVYFGTGSDLKNTIDHVSSTRRISTLADIKRAASVCDSLDGIDFIMSYGLPNDIPPEQVDIEAFLAMITHTTKPLILTSVDGPRSLERIYRISCAIAGGEDNLKRNPFWVLYGQFVSPFQHGKDSLERLLFCADRHIPIIYVPTVMSGASGPVTMAGSLALGNAEALAGLVIHQLRAPGAPFIYGGCICPFDMQVASIAYGAPEWHMASGVLAQLSRRYGLPVFGTGGCSDSKIIDEQAIAEATSSLLLEAHSGINLIHDVGYLESGLCGSLDFLVICNELIKLTKRTLSKFHIDTGHLAIDLIDKIGPGGNFLESEHTLNHFKEEVWYPELFDRQNFNNWSSQGNTTMLSRARAKLDQILTKHLPEPLAPAIIQEIDKILKR